MKMGRSSLFKVLRENLGVKNWPFSDTLHRNEFSVSVVNIPSWPLFIPVTSVPSEACPHSTLHASAVESSENGVCFSPTSRR